MLTKCKTYIGLWSYGEPTCPTPLQLGAHLGGIKSSINCKKKVVQIEIEFVPVFNIFT